MYLQVPLLQYAPHLFRANAHSQQLGMTPIHWHPKLLRSCLVTQDHLVPKEDVLLQERLHYQGLETRWAISLRLSTAALKWNTSGMKQGKQGETAPKPTR